MFCVVDIETTGGRYNEDRITEIAIIVYNGKKVVEEYSSLVNPRRPIQPFVASLTGISDKMVANAPEFKDIADRILELTEGSVFVAHNVRFDYGVIKREFGLLGIDFHRKQLCTVKLSRKLLPGYKSYSLGNICRDLGIPNGDRHRAYGDALATTYLLEKIFLNDNNQLYTSLIEEEIQPQLLPEKLSPEVIINAPEMTGVYQFLDENGKVLFVGKSRNIKKRLIAHFSKDENKKSWLKLKNQIYDIQYQITGSELIAEIVVSEEIKRFQPPFNMIKRNRKYRYALTVSKDQEGYYQFTIDPFHPDKRQLKKFVSKVSGHKFLDSWMTSSMGSAAFKKILSVEKYNEMAEKAMERLVWLKEDSIILVNGKSFEESGFILVENKEVKGYGFVENEIGISHESDLTVLTKDVFNTDEAKDILLKHLSKKRENYKIITKKK